jgi:hypothetical protein
MKRQFQSIAKKRKAIIKDYKTYRSDFGCQVYSIKLKLGNGKSITYDDSYFIGEDSGKAKVLKQFEKEISLGEE